MASGYGFGMDVARATALVAGAQRIVVLTGAGISTESGIPDFRGPNGVWTKDPAAAQLFTLQNYVRSPDVRRRAWRTRRDHPAFTAAPNAGHAALVTLERQGKLLALVTQNIDELHQRAGSSPERVIELHGTVWHVECLDCRDRTTMADTLTRVEAGEDDPRCLVCGGILKSATISFGQALDERTLRRAVSAAAECDLFIAIGTSLTVYPAAGLVDLAVDGGASVIIINAEPTPYDRAADIVIRSQIGVVLPTIVGQASTAVGPPERGRG
jgi:NAD-dependent deacetylase